MMFWNLAYPLVEPDESRYAQVALEMVHSGDYLVPRLQGEPYLDKPPLLYWATAASFRVFGETELAARIPSAVAALLTVLVTFLLGRHLLGDRTAWLGSLMLLLCLGFVLSARFLIMDGPLTLFTTICLFASLLAVRGSRLQLSWWLVAGVACGLGVMTKGPVAVVLTCPPLLALHWVGGRAASPRLRDWLVFATIVGTVALPWFILIGRSQGDFAGHFFWQHHIIRFVNAFNHQEPFWYYIPVLFAGMFPSSLLAAPVVFFLGYRGERTAAIADTGVGRHRADRRLDHPLLLALQLQTTHLHSAGRAAAVPAAGVCRRPDAGRRLPHTVSAEHCRLVAGPSDGSGPDRGFDGGHH